MALHIPTEFEPTIPNAHDSALAQESSRQLGSLLKEKRDVQVRILHEDRESQIVTLPAAALDLLMRILTEMAKGNAVTMMPHHAELTTQQAADVLNVSRPHLIKLLEGNEIPYHKTGTHRRIRFEDVLAYKRRTDEKRLQTLDELAALSQELQLDEPLE